MEKIRTILSKLGFKQTTIKRIVLGALIICAISGYKVVSNLASSDVAGSFTTYHKDPKTGEVTVGKLSLEKLAPDTRNKNLLVVSTNTDNTSYIGYYRRVTTVLDFELFLGIGVGRKNTGERMYQAGAVISF